jgi:WD40 repeat protein
MNCHSDTDWNINEILPLELVSHALSFTVESVADLWSLAGVCRLWRRLASSPAFWRLTGNMHPRLLERLKFVECPHINVLGSYIEIPSVNSPVFYVGNDKLRCVRLVEQVTQSPESKQEIFQVAWQSRGSPEMESLFLLCVEVFNDHVISGGRPAPWLYVWTDDGHYVRDLPGHSDEVYCLKVWRGLLYSGGYDQLIVVHDDKWQQVATLKGHTNAVGSMELWNNHLLTGSGSGCEVLVWDDKHNLKQKISWGVGGAKSLKLWNGLLYGSGYHADILAFTTDGELVKTLKGHSHWVLSLCVWNGLLFSAGADGTIRVWDAKGQCVKVVMPYQNSSETQQGKMTPSSKPRFCKVGIWNGYLLAGYDSNGGKVMVWKIVFE